MKRRAAMTTIAAGAALLGTKITTTEFLSKDNGMLYITMADMAKEIFDDQIERVIFVTAHPKLFVMQSGHAEKILGPPSWILEYLEKQGVKLEEVALIVHNHFSPQRFTAKDIETYHYFRNKGFKGLFAIYYPATGKVRVKNDG